MWRELFISLLIVAVINMTISCSVTSNKNVSKEELLVESEKIHAVILTNAEKITFDEGGGKLVVKDNLIEGKSKKGTKKSYPLSHLKTINWKESSASSKILNGKSQDFTEFMEKLSGKDQEKLNEPVITEVQTVHGRSLVYDDEGGKFFKQKIYITGLTEDKELIEINNSEILYAVVEKTNYAGSILASMGIIAGVILVLGVIALAAKQSCPFVYSYDGEKYVFDAEPLGGATTKGLQRTELSKLEHLAPSGGKYKLLVKNEVPETQYIDAMTLLLADHPENTKVYADLECNINIFDTPQNVIEAKDEFGKDISGFVRKEDGIFWQTQLPFDSTKMNNELRHELTFSFPKPETAETARLIINAGTSLWGSQMIREMQKLYGSQIDNWYDQIDNNIEAKEQMLQFIEREELYIMKALIKEKDGWIKRASINGGGPFISETRSYNLDIKNVEGDTLFIQFNIPYGFWTLDYLAVDFSDPQKIYSQEIELTNIINHKGKTVTQTLSLQDEEYYIMPEVGEYFYAEASVPPIRDNCERTVFLKSSGYYKLHLDKDAEIQTQILFDMASIPGMIVNYSMKCFNDWKQNLIK